MDLTAAIRNFVSVGRELFHLLRAEGQSVSELDLHILRAQLHVLQLETLLLKRNLGSGFTETEARLSERPTDGLAAAERAPTISSTAAYLKIGDRLRATMDHYPARIGAIGRVLYFKGMPGNWHIVIAWEQPDRNFSAEQTSHIFPLDLNCFEVVPQGV